MTPAPSPETSTRKASTQPPGSAATNSCMGVAVMRGLLLDVLAADDATDATAALDVFIDMWENRRS